MSKLEDFANKVYDFNELAGRFNNEYYTKEDFKLQIKLMKEELKELEDSFDNNESANVLKEWADCMVVTFGFGLMLEHIGYDCANALLEVGENNLSKFPKDVNVAYRTIDQLAAKEIVSYIEKHGERWAIKDESGKVRKPFNYVPADVLRFTPVGGLNIV